MTGESSAPAYQDRRSKPETFRARSLSVALTVDDIEESLAWYRDIAGFIVEEEYEDDGALQAAALLAGEVRLILTQDDGAKGWDRVKGEGISLHFETAQDVDDLARWIEERGGTLESPPADMPWGTRAFRLKDPNGFLMTIASEIEDDAG